MKDSMTLKFDKVIKNTYVFTVLKDDNRFPTVDLMNPPFMNQQRKLKLTLEGE